MAKKKASKQYEEEEEHNRKLSINSKEQGMDDELTSINNETETASPELEEAGNEDMEIPLIEMDMSETEEGESGEEEEEDLKEDKTENVDGKNVPPPKEERDPKLDKVPIEEEDLGLEDDDFLMERKVHQEDMEAHMELKEEGFVGSNVRRPRDFASIFEKGVSSKDDPKLDLSYALQYNPEAKKEVIAQQMLRNYHSRDSEEKANAERMFKEFNLDDEIMEAIQENDQAHDDDDLVQKLTDILPSNV